VAALLRRNLVGGPALEQRSYLRHACFGGKGGAFSAVEELSQWLPSSSASWEASFSPWRRRPPRCYVRRATQPRSAGCRPPLLSVLRWAGVRPHAGMSDGVVTTGSRLGVGPWPWLVTSARHCDVGLPLFRSSSSRGFVFPSPAHFSSPSLFFLL
jgi:hypothetical protein